MTITKMTLESAEYYIKEVYYPGYEFIVQKDGRGEMYLQASYEEEDIFTGKLEKQLTRRWFISPQMSKSELIQTAFKVIITSMEHRVREHFLYKNKLVFGPHFNVDKLWEIAHETVKREV